VLQQLYHVPGFCGPLLGMSGDGRKEHEQDEVLKQLLSLLLQKPLCQFSYSIEDIAFALTAHRLSSAQQCAVVELACSVHARCSTVYFALHTASAVSFQTIADCSCSCVVFTMHYHNYYHTTTCRMCCSNCRCCLHSCASVRGSIMTLNHSAVLLETTMGSQSALLNRSVS
jgi:hypothetical protein